MTGTGLLLGGILCGSSAGTAAHGGIQAQGSSENVVLVVAEITVVCSFHQLHWFLPPRRGRHCDNERFREKLYLFQFTPPAKGATRATPVMRRPPWCFNSRPAKGATPASQESKTTSQQFQFTPPRRGRHERWLPRASVTMFQFTPPRRGRHIRLDDSGYQLSFQFTPPRRGRRPPVWLTALVGISFNSRPREGGDGLQVSNIAGIFGVSIHAPREGGDTASGPQA